MHFELNYQSKLEVFVLSRLLPLIIICVFFATYAGVAVVDESALLNFIVMFSTAVFALLVCATFPITISRMTSHELQFVKLYAYKLFSTDKTILIENLKMIIRTPRIPGNHLDYVEHFYDFNDKLIYSNSACSEESWLWYKDCLLKLNIPFQEKSTVGDYTKGIYLQLPTR